MGRRIFGRLPDGREITEYVLRDGTAECSILSLGAAVRTLTVPDREGKPVDVLLGMEDVASQLAQDKYLGVTVGRFANRISGSAFVLDGIRYELTANEGKNQLHGGVLGFDKQLWSEIGFSESSCAASVALSLFSPAGQEGYPGDLAVTAVFELSNGELTIRYEAESSAPTPCSLTWHGYFDLSGHDSGSVDDHLIRIYSRKYLPTDGESIPTGEIAEVSGTPFDLREPCVIGERAESDHPQIVKARGFDHCFLIDGEEGALRPAAEAYSPKTGIRMKVATDQPALQFYTAGFLSGGPAGKGGAVYRDRGAFCIETQSCPDAPNKPQFPRSILRPGEKYSRTTVYSFDTKPPASE